MADERIKPLYSGRVTLPIPEEPFTDAELAAAPRWLRRALRRRGIMTARQQRRRIRAYRRRQADLTYAERFIERTSGG